MTSSDSVISVRHLMQRYGRGRIIYEDLSFDVRKGSILGLLGKNGTGKTTTINILMGYLKPPQGECRIFGEDAFSISPITRARIALLLEGHVQYGFMSISQIERFYSAFYPRWNKDAYYELMRKLHVSPKQTISSMSCGQRSQVALGLILAQNADLLVLDDFSLGLDPGYRRLFTEYLREYAKAEEKTVFMTSHIIEDLERLIDDCIILDYGRILVQMPVSELLQKFSRYTFNSENGEKLQDNKLLNTSQVKETCETYSFENLEYVTDALIRNHIVFSDLRKEKLSLEDAFIGLTGKY